MAIPNRLNTAVVALQLLAVAACFSLCRGASAWWQLVLLAVAFAVVMNSVYFAVHESEHGVLFSNRRANYLAGAGLALLLPAPYSVIRQIHLAHHIYNRSDNEVFDLY